MSLTWSPRMTSKQTPSLAGSIGLCLVLAVNALGHDSSASRTALDDYIAKPDSTYSWRVVKTIPGNGYTAFVLDLKSQTWRTSPEVNRPVWQHWLTIVKPNHV